MIYYIKQSKPESTIKMKDRTERLKLIFDSCSLITASKFNVDGKLIIDYLLEFAEIHIPEEVCFESIKEYQKYADAKEIKRRVDDKKIIVHEVPWDKTIFKDLEGYHIGLGEKEIILLYQDKRNFDYVIIDDFLAGIIANRFNMNCLLLLDLIVIYVKKNFLTKELAIKLVQAVQSRYDKGFINHTISMIERSEK